MIARGRGMAGGWLADCLPEYRVRQRWYGHEVALRSENIQITFHFFLCLTIFGLSYVYNSHILDYHADDDDPKTAKYRVITI